MGAPAFLPSPLPGLNTYPGSGRSARTPLNPCSTSWLPPLLRLLRRLAFNWLGTASDTALQALIGQQ